MRRQLLPALRIVLVFTVLLGLAYPLLVTGVAQAVFSDKADGSFVTVNGEKVGSSLIGQSFTKA
ncbi:MAG TPA: potassium-transporting ATPase subunit C, partial [Solirubrobacterales bacterium]|nr:potassium-transporting ATPase subunit C [Solirubrobacterales bacterium]